MLAACGSQVFLILSRERGERKENVLMQCSLGSPVLFTFSRSGCPPPLPCTAGNALHLMRSAVAAAALLAAPCAAASVVSLRVFPPPSPSHFYHTTIYKNASTSHQRWLLVLSSRQPTISETFPRRTLCSHYCDLMLAAVYEFSKATRVVGQKF